jgi:hypothetical protein
VSEIEIVFDPKWEAACAGLAMSEDHEVCADGEWILYARRLTGIKDLFVYHHKRANSWVLAKWLFHPSQTDSPVALELESMPAHPNDPTSGRLVGEALIARCKPVDEMVESMKERLKRANSHRRAMKDERIESKKGAVKYMRSRGMDEGARALEDGACGWMAPSECTEQYSETVSELMAMAKAT